jgi:hypothetical protein
MHPGKGSDMTASIDVARPAKAPGAVISRGPGQPLPPRAARRQRDAILIVILLAAAARSARLAKAAGAQISPVPDGPPPQPVSRQRAAILIVVALAAEADLAAVAMVAVVLAAIRELVRDSQVIPRTLSWYFGPVSTWHMRRLRRRYLHQQMLDAPVRLSTFGAAGNPISNGARTMDRRSQMRLDGPWSPGTDRWDCVARLRGRLLDAARHEAGRTSRSVLLAGSGIGLMPSPPQPPR